jgi:hypothetical protein
MPDIISRSLPKFIIDRAFNAETPTAPESIRDGDTGMAYVDSEATHFKKEMGWLSIVAVSFDSMATWNTFPSTLLVSFVYGGPAATVWGIMLVGIIYIPIALTLCELVSAYPSIGGQYHWSSILAPPKYRRGIVSHPRPLLSLPCSLMRPALI